jgi:hypothetical protein
MESLIQAILTVTYTAERDKNEGIRTNGKGKKNGKNGKKTESSNALK